MAHYSIPSDDGVYTLVRKCDATGKMEQIRFDVGILVRMQVAESEWKPMDLEATYGKSK